MAGRAAAGGPPAATGAAAAGACTAGRAVSSALVLRLSSGSALLRHSGQLTVRSCISRHVNRLPTRVAGEVICFNWSLKC